MDEEIYTVEDIFERDTPLTEDLFDNSDGLTLSPITMLRRYMAEKELKKQKEDAEETAEEAETDLIESMGYMNGGGIGSMMQPKQNFLNGGRVGLFMGGLPLDGEALAIYNSMNAYGYDDQTIADKLLALNLYTPPGTTPPDATPPPPPPAEGGNSGGDGGGAGTTTTTTKDRISKNLLSNPNVTFDRPTMADIVNEKTTDPLAERLSSLPPSAALAAALGSTNASSALDQLILSNEITDRNRGMEDNENFIDRGDPNNDLRVASEEMGLVGGIPDRNRGQISPSTIQEVASALDRPNMADIANTVSKDNSISVKDFTSPSNVGDFAVTSAEALANQTGMIDGPPSIGFAKDPEGVEDPFGGKYTPSFEKEDLTGLAGLIDNFKGINFKDALTPNNLLTGAAGSKFASIFGIPGAIGSFGANQFRKKSEANRIEKAIAASKNRKETRALQAKIDAAEKKRQDDITKTDNANAKAAAAGKAYDYSGRSNKKGTHTSTVSKQKAADNRESRRGQTSSNKGSSNKGSSNKGSSSKGSTSSGAGGGGGASRGGGGSRSSGRNSSQRGGGFNSMGFSDIRLKDNIELVGKSPSNINIYNFTYLKDSKVYQGVMAHEVPWASVKHDSGYLMVDYNKVDVDFKIIH